MAIETAIYASIAAEEAFKKVRDELDELEAKHTTAILRLKGSRDLAAAYSVGIPKILDDIKKMKVLLSDAAVKWAESEEKAKRLTFPLKGRVNMFRMLNEEKKEHEKTKLELTRYKMFEENLRLEHARYKMTEEEEIHIASIRAKEGAKKHAEAKAKLQKLYDERPMINLMDGESIGDLLVCM